MTELFAMKKEAIAERIKEARAEEKLLKVKSLNGVLMAQGYVVVSPPDELWLRQPEYNNGVTRWKISNLWWVGE